MLAGSGRYFWFALAALAISAVVFLSSINGPRLRSGPSASRPDPVAIISAVTGLLGAIATLITALDKFGSGKQPAQQVQTAGTGTRPPQPDDFPDYETPSRAPPAKRYKRGDILEYVRRDRRDNRYDLVEVRRFEEYDTEGYEVWTVIDKYREYRP